ncbi:YhgE/Pip domain-containing protein [Paenibacillus sp. BC26]|uniref:YhgE/Pip domain-containing protein n=1 Tax=Paenibacillus sp. BC26 TaxID=1881032 RepID=UPI0008E11A70|nr:YhgE/Pip domain-containing protein [Paenibacillus sp. BC26]SFT15711.1 putative membrane protein [Paenibacillus sp. BC26]
MSESKSGGLRLAWLDVKTMWISRAVRISLLGLLVLPLLYSFIYLWAFWDPTGRTDQLPLAVVNEDTGAKRSGEQRNLGRELTDELIKSDETYWIATNRKQAHNGLMDGKYAMVLYLPADFSKLAFSVSGDDPRPTTLDVELNEGANALSAKVVRAIAGKVQDNLRKELQGNYLSVIFEQVLNGAEGLQEAADGAAQLSDASERAYQGAAQLTQGLRQTEGGLAKLSGGVQALTAGADELNKGIGMMNTYAERAASEWKNWSSKLNAVNQSLAALLGASKPDFTASLEDLLGDLAGLESELNAIKKSSDQLGDLTTQLQNVKKSLGVGNGSLDTASGLLQDLGDKFPAFAADDKYKQLSEELADAQQAGTSATTKLNQIAQTIDALATSLDGSITKLTNRISQLSPGLEQFRAQLSELQSAVDKAAGELDQQHIALSTIDERVKDITDGVNRLQTGSGKLKSGLAELGGGVSALQTGNAKLVAGAESLTGGLAQIHKGQAELADKLTDAAGLASEDGQADARQAVINDPVMLEEHNLHPVPNNGVGFAPYFIALSLWVGALVLFFVIDIWQVLERPHGPLSYIVSKYIALATISVCQALLSVFILHVGLGIPTVVPSIAMYGYAALVGIVFTAILYMLIAVLGSDKGRFAAVLILMLQLTSSSGSYPVTLEPPFFQYIHPLLPMTYAVEGLRHLISIGGWNAIIRTAGVLSGFGLGSLLLFYLLKRRKIMSEIRLTGE